MIYNIKDIVIKSKYNFDEMNILWGERCNNDKCRCANCIAWKIFDIRMEIPNIDDVVSFPDSRIRYRCGAD